MRIVITGADGYLGTGLCEKFLSLGDEVIGIVPSGMSIKLSDDVDLKNLSCVHVDDVDKLTAHADALINLAWIGVGGALQGDCDLQIKSMAITVGYYELAKRLGCKKFISIGTVGENQLKVVKDLRKYRNANYVLAKAAVRDMLLAGESDGCKVVWARLGTLYGENCRGRTLIAYAVDALSRGVAAEFGPAEQYYDFVHRDDCSTALYLLAHATELKESVYYIGGGEPQRLKEFLHIVGDAFGRPDLVRIGAREDDGSCYLKEWFDIAPLTRDTGYRPTVSFDVGIKRLVKGSS